MIKLSFFHQPPTGHFAGRNPMPRDWPERERKTSTRVDARHQYSKQDRGSCFLTWSGLRPGGTHVYSSSAHPLSSSLCECLWWCIRASWRARPGGGGWTGLLNGSWWEEPAAPLWKAMAMAIGGPGPRPSPEGPPASVEVRWCSSRGHLQLLHTFLKRENRRPLVRNEIGTGWLRARFTPSCQGPGRGKGPEFGLRDWWIAEGDKGYVGKWVLAGRRWRRFWWVLEVVLGWQLAIMWGCSFGGSIKYGQFGVSC